MKTAVEMDSPPANRPGNPHRHLDARALAMDRLILERVRARPELLETVHHTLDRWLQTADPAVRPALEEWKALLEGPRGELLAVLAGEDERSVRLRQSSPFCGILTREERTRILLEHRP